MSKQAASAGHPDRAANSGHPGAPLGMADMAEVLWRDYLKHNPANPRWADRDRFVLSNGHGSMLLYSLLYLTGYDDFPLDQLKNFRQLGYRTAGHPEFEAGGPVETTTGPLGQGLTNAVGMAMAEKMLAAEFNRPGHEIVDHRTWVFVGDGCLMEGISHEACSLAGTLKLGKLICLYDDNNISIDGEVDAWFTDDTAKRFDAYGWQVIPGVDGHDPAAIAAAIDAAVAETERPTIICCKTVIGFGAPTKAGKASSHGAPLGDEEIAGTRKQLGWEPGPFEIPADIAAAWDGRESGAAAQSQWDEAFAAYSAAHPELAAEFARRMAGELPHGWCKYADAAIAEIDGEAAKLATRQASLRALNAYAPFLPEMVGGSADLTGSNLTRHAGSTPISGEDAGGNYVWFGVREFGMTAICNGIRLHGGFIPYSGTFLTFSDYSRNALRMAALMKVQNILVFTHDSIGLGEDGPTHQPVEQTASLRLMPNMSVWRPCDAVETAVAWRHALENDTGPTSLVLTRQGVPHQPRSAEQLAAIAQGGYVLRDCDGEPDILLIATGSEVALAVDAAETLAADGVRARVVSMPSTDAFNAQDMAYRESVLPAAVTARIAIEAGVTDGWWRYVGPAGRVIGLDRFGESAPANELFEHFGFTTGNVVKVAKDVLNQ
jgi:transketolase